MTKLTIECVTAGVDDRYSEDKDTNWNTVAMGNTYPELLSELLTGLNDDEISIDNSWLRLASTDEQGKITYTNY